MRLRSLSLRVVHRHTAASSSTSPFSTGQHWFTTGSPSPMCTSPPSRSTHAPSFTASTGHVAPVPAGGVGVVGGHGFPPVDGGFPPVDGGFPPVPGGNTGVTGVTGGTGMTGVTGGTGMTGGTVIGGSTTGAGFFLGLLGCLGFLGCVGLGVGLGVGLVFGWSQEPQLRMGVREEKKSMEMSRRAMVLEDPIMTRVREGERERDREMEGLGFWGGRVGVLLYSGRDEVCRPYDTASKSRPCTSIHA